MNGVAKGAVLALVLMGTASCTASPATVDGTSAPTVSATAASAPASPTPSPTATAGPTEAAPTNGRPIVGAMGAVTLGPTGVPVKYVVVADDTVGGIQRRFGISNDTLAKANMAPFTFDVGVNVFLHVGDVVDLVVRLVDGNSGKGAVVNNAAGNPIFYTTVKGDSLDSIGYQFRVNTRHVLMYNPGLCADAAIPVGTRVSLMAGPVTVPNAEGSYTADAAGVPLTYTTVSGDTELQVASRFNLELVQLADANRPHDNATPE